MLKAQVQDELKLLGLKGLQDALFYNCQYGIRFEIGVGDIYNKDRTPREEYIENALNRVITIYNKGMKSPGILVWKIYPQSKDNKNKLLDYFSEKVISVSPHEEFADYIDDDNDIIKQVHLY